MAFLAVVAVCAVAWKVKAESNGGVNNDGNIQNLFHKAQIQQMLEATDFQIVKQGNVDSTYLQDAKWEKSYVNSIRSEFGTVPSMIQTLVNS